MKGFNEDGKVLVYGMNEFMEREELIPVATIERNGIEYAIIDNNESKGLCYPCEKVSYSGNNNFEESMVSFVEPEAYEHLKTSGKLVEIELE